MPSFLPPPPMKEEIIAIDIEAWYHEYQTLKWEIHESYSFKKYIFKYGFRHKKENDDSYKRKEEYKGI